MKRDKVKLASLVVGIIVMLAIVLSQMFYYSVDKTNISKEVKQEQQDTNPEKVSISIASSSLPSSTHVEVVHDSFFLFEIIYTDKNVEQTCADSLIPSSKLLATLFRTIITPNAP